MEQEKSFLGRGWSFPPTVRKEMADIEMVSKEEDIRQSLQIFFNTKIGERIMRSNYGCIVHEYMFQKAESNVLDKLAFELQQSLRFYEPRIKVIDIKTSKSDVINGLVNFEIIYEVNSTNVRDNIVFPFYINEGTEIKKS